VVDNDPEADEDVERNVQRMLGDKNVECSHCNERIPLGDTLALRVKAHLTYELLCNACVERQRKRFLETNPELRQTAAENMLEAILRDEVDAEDEEALWETLARHEQWRRELGDFD
jgi:hypothetical protein